MGVSAAWAAAAVSAYSSYNANENAKEAQQDQKAAAAKAEASKPQTSKAPDIGGIQGQMSGSGQAGGAPGVAQTFLTGATGIDPSLLQLGKNTLLGGGG